MNDLGHEVGIDHTDHTDNTDHHLSEDLGHALSHFWNSWIASLVAVSGEVSVTHAPDYLVPGYTTFVPGTGGLTTL